MRSPSRTDSGEWSRPTGAAILSVFLAANAVQAGTNDFQWQMITLSGPAGAAHFAAVDNDGRSALLALDPEAGKLSIYHQRAWGFTNTPDQVIQLPPQTAWIAPYDVDPHPGLELLMSTAGGLVYYRQNGGAFESEPRLLIQAGQVFTNDDPPILISLATNAPIPVISATQAVLYRRNDAFEWRPGSRLALEEKRNSWSANRNEWMVGASSSYNLFIQQSVRPKPTGADSQEPDPDAINPQHKRKGPIYQRADEEKPENAAIGKLIEDMKKTTGPWHQPGMNRVDLNGDGRMDLVLWQIVGDIQWRTDIYVFLRGADGKLPERPTQVLHCRGFPMPVGSTHAISPFGDLKGDGSYELILLDLKSTLTSADSVMEMALSRGLDWAITIRSFNHGAFSRSPDAAVPMRAILSSVALEQWPFFICGDFNGDGRPDLVVQRSPNEWNIFPSTDDPAGRDWFAPQPALTFETPMQGYFEINDLDGDGRSDLVLRGRDDPRIFVSLSTLRNAAAANAVHSERTKGRKP